MTPITQLISDTNLDQYLETKEDKTFFHSKGEHYDLLSTISQQYNNIRIYDIGTYKGQSALALSSNQTNLVISYDIRYFVHVKQPSNMEVRIGNFYHDSEMLKSPLIMFDIDPHNGNDERQFVDNLISQNYKGTVVFDDIHLNDGMKKFWSSITQEKHDYTHLGHWSGTGVVIFK
jgi:hypothetical protein